MPRARSVRPSRSRPRMDEVAVPAVHFVEASARAPRTCSPDRAGPWGWIAFGVNFAKLMNCLGEGAQCRRLHAGMKFFNGRRSCESRRKINYRVDLHLGIDHRKRSPFMETREGCPNRRRCIGGSMRDRRWAFSAPAPGRLTCRQAAEGGNISGKESLLFFMVVGRQHHKRRWAGFAQ